MIKVKKIFPWLVTVFLAAFGLLTLFLSTSIILDLFGIRALEGNYVLFVVWANFICSILYLIAAYGFAAAKPWTTHILAFATIILTVAFAGLLLYINNGGIYETKTIGAIIFRTLVTLVFAAIAYFSISKKVGRNIMSP